MVIMGPNDYYWLLLGKSREEIGIAEELMPSMKLKKSWETIFSGKSRQVLEERLFPVIWCNAAGFHQRQERLRWLKLSETSALRAMSPILIS